MMYYDSIHSRGTDLNRDQRYADLGHLLAHNWDTVARALRIATNVDEAGLVANTECGHVVPDGDTVGTESGDLCRACYDALPPREDGFEDDD